MFFAYQLKAQSHQRDARSAHRKIWPERCCASNFCQNLEEASELTMHAQHVASALDVYSAHAERIQSVRVKKATSAQRVAGALNEWAAHAARTQRTASER